MIAPFLLPSRSPRRAISYSIFFGEEGRTHKKSFFFLLLLLLVRDLGTRLLPPSLPGVAVTRKRQLAVSLGEKERRPHPSLLGIPSGTQ